mmetsp:Transcript_7802/g.25449  ORF Transcript_7802/g.25449 Transcript_7802/m.25449 type:complete len:245 (+) Transcript_7802:203-937(+)
MHGHFAVESRELDQVQHPDQIRRLWLEHLLVRAHRRFRESVDGALVDGVVHHAQCPQDARDVLRLEPRRRALDGALQRLDHLELHLVQHGQRPERLADVLADHVRSVPGHLVDQNRLRLVTETRVRPKRVRHVLRVHLRRDAFHGPVQLRRQQRRRHLLRRPDGPPRVCDFLGVHLRGLFLCHLEEFDAREVARLEHLLAFHLRVAVQAIRDALRGEAQRARDDDVAQVRPALVIYFDVVALKL